jgi:hypothetical protein
MAAKDYSEGKDKRERASALPAGLIVTGLLTWGAISLGFFGLKMLMEERPEFVGQPMRTTQAELVQESPQVVVRKVSDDVSVVRPTQPELSEVRFDMTGRRDYRGLRTISDMFGECRARYILSNAFEEPAFVLFKCPHPHTEHDANGSLLAGELKLRGPTNGVQETTKDAWFWTGTIDRGATANIEVSYRVASLKGVTYRVAGQTGTQVKHVRVVLDRKDIPAMRVESGDGTQRPADDSILWERKDFLAPDFFSAHVEESRSLHASLLQLLEIGPLITLLFLVAVSAVMLTRRELTALQILTIAAGYAIYFPLIVYLSANMSFKWALVLALLGPGVLLVNYARWLVGPRLGLLGGVTFLALYQLFPTLAAFAGWHRGMVLLCLGVVTLAVVINLQNRALRQRAVAMATVIVLLFWPLSGTSAQVQVLMPAELADKLTGATRENAIIAFEPAQYKVQEQASHFRVEARVPFQVARPGSVPVPLFNAPVYLQESHVEGEANTVSVVTTTNGLGLLALESGRGTLGLIYRVPLQNREGNGRTEIPLISTVAGTVQLESGRNNLQALTGTLWSKATRDKSTLYDIGVAAADMLDIEWRDDSGGVAASPARVESAKEFYGIGITRAQNLTIVNSDSSCTHFAEFELPVSQSDEFQVKLPAKARLISASVNGVEITSPPLENQLCRIRLLARTAQQSVHHVSFRLAYPAVRLGFLGAADLALPEVFQTVGTLEWVVALPTAFATEVISSGLERQTAVPNLDRFGDYGRILKSHPHTYLAKDLAPPGPVQVNLKYRQMVAGLYEARTQ